MLLLFICILVHANEITFKDEVVDLGEIYMRLVRCLYRKFVICKGSESKKNEFKDILKCVAKVAWDTLQSRKGWFKSSKFTQLVGEDAFEAGLVIGEKGKTLSGHEMADISITFPHRTIQEFFSGILFY